MAFSIEMMGQSDAIFTFDRDDIPFHSGACDADIEDFVSCNSEECSKLTREFCLEALRCTGGWEAEELAEEDDDALIHRVVWIAAGNAYDSANEEAYIDSDTVEGFVSTY